MVETTLHADRALLPQGWATDVRLTLRDGRIAAIGPASLAGAHAGMTAGAEVLHVPVLLPGMPNLHSHAHQRGMAGLVEHRGPQADSFWTWRTLMYRFCDRMTPDQFEAIAAQAYVEMLESGFVRVGEFHYLHHDRDGNPFADRAEMCGRAAAAAKTSGIGLTLLPVFYAHGGFGGQAPGGPQRRFINDVDGYARLLDGAREAVRGLPGAHVGVAPHSLRAVTPDELRQVVALVPADAPVHIHIAEQTKEVDDCLAWSGARPVQWLLANAPVDARWCLVHATHMTESESAAMARRGAVAGLCPITEANLGDGIFDAPAFVDAGGRFGIGSDSNVQYGVAEELRLLEYSQRFARRERNVMARRVGSTGQSLFEAALAGGRAALLPSAGDAGTPAGLVVGAPADLVSLGVPSDGVCVPDERLLDAWIFGGRIAVDRVWVGGRCLVEGGRHRGRDAVTRRFGTAMQCLLSD